LTKLKTMKPFILLFAKLRCLLPVTLFLCLCLQVEAKILSPKFQRINYSQGLSDNKVNCVFKSSSGFVWIGTPMGLNRYDGIRIRNYFALPNVPNSLVDNNIENIMEDASGHLWIRTIKGYSIFDPFTETFDNNTALWMKQHAMSGEAARVATDEHRNLWILTANGQLYHYDFAKEQTRLLVARTHLPANQATDLQVKGREVLIAYNKGQILRLGFNGQKITRQTSFKLMPASTPSSDYNIYIDSRGQYWIYSNNILHHYDNRLRQWHSIDGYIVKGVGEDKNGRILLATDHEGMVVLSPDGKRKDQWLYDPSDPLSLPDNTLQTIYVDNLGIVWVGTYRMGLACYMSGNHYIDLLPLGDVCSMSQDHQGKLWLGFNDRGLGCYDLKTGSLTVFSRKQTHLGSDVVVATLCTDDGSLWLGTYQGGMACLRNGHYTVWRSKSSGLASDDVWALCQLPDKRIAVGTLGGGLQIYDPNRKHFTTYNTHNSKLPSDYISSLTLDHRGHLVIGHSRSVSLMRLSDMSIRNISPGRLVGNALQIEPSVNQVVADKRGLIWTATTMGLSVYESQTGRSYIVPLQGARPYVDVSGIVCDHNGRLWVTTADGLRCVMVSGKRGNRRFFITAFSQHDGVQTRLFNKRSMLCLSDGRVLAGGIDGVNVIEPVTSNSKSEQGNVIFSDFMLFDHLLKVGEEVNGHVVLKEAINESRHIVLRHNENNFSILLASTPVGEPIRERFIYRLKGLGDQWLTTSEDQNAVKFNNLSPGDYQLEVRRLYADGSPHPEVASLSITIKPPFYLSTWAWMLYFAIAVLLAIYIRRTYRRRREVAMERLEMKQQQELDEMKMTFFTNVSHELRTPLTLIMSPLPGIIAKESNAEIVNKLKLIQRNAYRMLGMVNDVLDLRRIIKGKEMLSKQRGDIVALTKGICKQFIGLTDKDVTLTFMSDAQSIILDFDHDKMDKIFTNLLSNAFKFMGSPGRIEVKVKLGESNMVLISVADNGPGIPEEDKKHLFDRFYQSRDNRQGGSGIGLNLVAVYTQMHGGTVSVEDNEKGGTVFTVTLPLGNAEIEGKKYVVARNGGADHEEKSLEAAGSQTTTPKYSVLVVDDNEDFVTFLRSELSADYHILVAANGKEALSVIMDERPDVILSDVMMPVMDGNELCKRLKSDPKTRSIPFVMLTAQLSEEDEIKSRKSGADDYLKKPFSMNLLRLHISQLIEKGQVSSPDGKVEPRISQTEITPENKKFVEKATEYVEKHLDDTSLSVESMSRDLGMSRVNLYRHLTAATGKKPTEFIRLIRLLHAEKLVMKSQLSVAEIAYSVGFSSPRYFTRCYKEQFGYLPSQYQKSNGKESENN
jgi:signal transduction histidine kinase/ligand-binding sensor domain-containing protein/DNA-binding response OmpR family regulator